MRRGAGESRGDAGGCGPDARRGKRPWRIHRGRHQLFHPGAAAIAAVRDSAVQAQPGGRFHALQSLFLRIPLLVLDNVLRGMDPMWATGASPARWLHVAGGVLFIMLLIATCFKRHIVLPLAGQLAERLVWPS